jgi:predicted O-methyltransferase YrrM
LPLSHDDLKYIDKSGSGLRYVGKECSNKITQLYGDSATFDFSFFWGSIDFVFVDGSHSYEYVLNDSRVALRLLKKNGGIIVWHDYDSWEGVTRALDELFVKAPEFNSLVRFKGTSLACLMLGS